MRSQRFYGRCVSLLLLFSLNAAACIQPIAAPPSAAAPASDPVVVFDAFHAAVNTHDVEKALSFFADDAVAHFPNSEFPNSPPPNVFTGATEIRTWLEIDFKDNIHVEVENTKLSGDTVSATASVDLDSLPPDLILVGLVEVTVKNGKITSFTHTLNDETLANLEAAANSPLKELVGAWHVVTTIDQQNDTFPALLTFTSDGIVFGDEPPAPFETTAHGNWVTTGPSAAGFTFLALIGSEEGVTKLSAMLKLVGSLEYDAQSDSWSGPYRLWINDVNGQELLAESGTFAGTRIAVEKLD